MTYAEQMIELLRYASQTKVAEALHVKRQTVWAWAHGKDVSANRVRQVRDLLRPPAAREPAPLWVERLMAGVMALETKGSVTDVELARAQAKAAAYLVAGLEQPQPAGVADKEESIA